MSPVTPVTDRLKIANELSDHFGSHGLSIDEELAQAKADFESKSIKQLLADIEGKIAYQQIRLANPNISAWHAQDVIDRLEAAKLYLTGKVYEF